MQSALPFYHRSPRRGYIFQTPEAQASQSRIWGVEVQFQTEEEFVQTLRNNKDREMMDLALTAFSPMSIDEIRTFHDYTYEVARKNPDVIFGHWLSFDPRIGRAGVEA